MCKPPNYICTQPPTANLSWEYFRLQSQSLQSSMQISFRKIFLMKQELWQHNTSHSKLYLTGSSMIEKITSWNKKVSVVQLHDRSFIRQCNDFQMSLSSFAPQEGNQVKHGQQMKSKKRDPPALGRLQQYRWTYSLLSCFSSRKDVRKRCHCSSCTWKRSLLPCAVSTLPCINDCDGEIIEYVTSLPS